MTRLGPAVFVRGEVWSSNDIRIEGRVEGSIWCEGCAVIVEPSAVVSGDINGRDITVAGVDNATMLARDVVDIRTSANVTGRVLSARFILSDGGTFHGDVRPQQAEAALTIAKHRRKEQAS